jgi:Ser-tRNA(Ala) deacylase AlaX
MNEKADMKEKLDIKQMIKGISMKTSVKVLCEFCVINAITAAGYRENKMWTDDEDEALNALIREAHKTAIRILELQEEEAKERYEKAMNSLKDYPMGLIDFVKCEEVCRISAGLEGDNAHILRQHPNHEL